MRHYIIYIIYKIREGKILRKYEKYRRRKTVKKGENYGKYKTVGEEDERNRQVAEDRIYKKKRESKNLKKQEENE